MKLKNKIIFFFILFLQFLVVSAQDSVENYKTKNFQLIVNGYINTMQTALFRQWDENWLTQNLIHNRINSKFYYKNILTLNLDIRNRILYNEIIDSATMAAFDNDLGYFDGNKNIVENPSMILNTALDRANLNFEKGKFNLILGRQRINWGQCYAWNPNDIFNASSFFDFDYPEKPGSDGLRLIFYHGMASQMEAIVKMNHSKKVTLAAFIKANYKGYDLQFLAGSIDEQDYVIGTGWNGSIYKAGFRGEISYFHPAKFFEDTSGILVGCIGADYMFKNSFYLQAEILYQQENKNTTSENFMQYYSNNLSAKKLSFTQYNCMLNSSYTFHPLVNGSLAIMAFPGVNGFFVNPSMQYFLSDNANLALFYQHFQGDLKNIGYEEFHLLALRLKMSF